MPDNSVCRDGRWVAVDDRDRRREGYSAKQHYHPGVHGHTRKLRVSNKPSSVTRL
ncbi:hypothetical protein HALO59_70011 [Halomonas sp. 59]|nr:hypothetical protein HALO156_120325 [Halomonas sp. 156]CAD5292621.1 hypothetical protein HALO113_90011 [Halomonas sp. 113]CAD5293832.1 hypothetical protein HALO59_70011 [Halomonas sp. 59]CAD5297297.1 hypothetical protein HALOI3_80011 [Halomonas sp. I3]VXB62170.1 hypothetical protein HALO153_190011 [Halomonas titanicae]